jgi:hypothetical protein
MAELSKAELDELVEQAIVDAYGEDEQVAGFYTMIEEIWSSHSRQWSWVPR